MKSEANGKSVGGLWLPDEQAAKYFLAAIIESSQDSVVTIDLNRLITTWNKGAEELYGYKSDEVVGKPLSMVLLPKDINDLIEKINSIVHEVRVPLYETVRLHKNGKTADLQVALSPVRDAAGTVIGISTIARDITEAKLQEQLKDEFISVASHELKSPVTSIKAYSEILMDAFKDSADANSYSMLTKLDAQIDRLMDLIKVLLDATRLSAGEVPLKLERFNIHQLFERIAEPVQLVSPNHNIVIEGEANCSIVADEKLIGQAITNLITNAIRYSPHGGKVIVACKNTPVGVEVSVQDFGIGIPEGLSEKIFERYFRVNRKNNAGAPGIGLGLYITAQIIHQHGGTIHVASEEGVGSTFTLQLPRME